MVERLVPVTKTANAPPSSAASTLSTRASVSSSSDSARDDRRVAVLRDEPGIRGVEVRATVRERRDVAVDEVPHERLEARRVDRVLVRADHDDVADRRRGAWRKGGQPHVVGRSIPVVRRRALSVRLPPSSVTIAAIASAATTIQAPIVNRGWRAHAAASDPVESPFAHFPTRHAAYVSATTPDPSVRESTSLSTVP